ncbi:Gfo/Idh/MocA family protein [Paenibacillus xerothermodurans]|uniref:Gfo/Idh/MocA family oxidoreductase n=1 Tax=Paenibacillus xerothermodurans TaxID=1977292 RepID=A0A2W1NXS8_PAEXE|nr:Gfo/Idh/MocA family oxidoreductase [Paenibacillus xerothermodurans]PZE20412.1 gfo/Idh/MocA family oxidoreductase [Paenibacillus xerothermodurans]
MIGYKFMGKAHSHAYRDVPFFFDVPAVPVLQAIAGRDEAGVQAAASRMGWLSHETDWRRLIERKDIDLIDIVTPNYMHAEMAIAALEAGKHVLCEKPLAMSADQAKRMLQAADRSGKVHMVCHNYRYASAIQYAKKLISEGRLGRIYHIRATYLQDWIMDPQFPLVWRLQKEVCGSGTHGDLAAHIIDLARYLVGEVKEVVGTMETFIKERPMADASGGLSATGKTGTVGQVDVDDASVFIARFENGAIGTFEATRFAAGNRNGQRLEINGELGSIRWDLENMNNLGVYLSSDEQGMQGFRTINCTEESHPYAGAYWPAAHITGYEHTFINMISELMKGIAGGYSPAPDFSDGYRNQLVLDAVERSSESKTWVPIQYD